MISIVLSTLLSTITASPTATTTEATSSEAIFSVSPIYTAGKASCNIPALLFEDITTIPDEIGEELAQVEQLTNITEAVQEVIQRLTSIDTYAELGEVVDAIAALSSGDYSDLESVLCWRLVSE